MGSVYKHISKHDKFTASRRGPRPAWKRKRPMATVTPTTILMWTVIDALNRKGATA